MGYEIPQQLQHKEKIMFGLTFGQLAWALFFGSIVLLIFAKGEQGFATKFIIAIFPATFGILFIFFDVSTWLKHLYYFLQFRSANLKSLKMKQLLGINKIEDDKIHTNAHKVAILQIEPINFNIKTKAEKETIIFGFQKFLNSLDFPIQFVVHTNPLNINPYFESLKKRSKMQSLFYDFETFMNQKISANNIRNRVFYIIIPETTDLTIQCNVCIERLSSIGLFAKRLEQKEIINNLIQFFNEVQKERSSDEDVTDPTHFLIAPDFVKDNVDQLIVNDNIQKIVTAVGFPRIVESGFLDKIISSNDNYDICIHVEPFSIETMMIMLNRELQKQRADLYAEELKKSINPSLEIKYSDTKKVLEELQKGEEKLFNVSLYINCKGKTKEEVNLLTKKVESELNSLMIIPSVPLFRQIQAYKSMIPIAQDELKIKRNITTRALSAFFPFTSPFLKIDQQGVMIGLNKNKIPIIRDIFGLSNANGMVLATSGAGKSYFTKLLIARQILNGTDVIIVDPQSEYLDLVEQYKGQIVDISKDSKTIINPLDLMGHDYVEKRLNLMDLFKIVFGDLTEIQKSILDKAINETYERKGINIKKQTNKPPVLGDLYKVLIQQDKKASSMEKVTYRALINRLYMYTEGVFSFLNKPTNIDFNNKMVCFNIGDMPKQVKPVIMFLILDYVYMKMKETKERKLLVIDEAWSLLGRAEDASYIFEIVKTCRKYNMGLLLITQDVADLLNSKAGSAVLANSSYSLLLRQKPAIVDSVVRTFNISQMEKEYILTAPVGKGILIMDNEHLEIEVIASPKEHELITTNADEVIKKRKKIVEAEKDVNITLDTSVPFYKKSNLSNEEIVFLANNKYIESNQTPIGAPRSSAYLVRQNGTESSQHIFLVASIVSEIRKYTNQVASYQEAKPDILFRNKAGDVVAIEVETGLGFDKHKKRLEQKFQRLKKEYKHWHLVLTDATTKYQYKVLGVEMYLRNDVPQLIKAYFL